MTAAAVVLAVTALSICTAVVAAQAGVVLWEATQHRDGEGIGLGALLVALALLLLAGALAVAALA